MAIDFFCYSSLTSEEAVKILDFISDGNREIFEKKFIISKVKDLRSSKNYYESVEIDIALEHGLNARCSFMLSLNDKGASGLISEVLKIIKSAFGEGNIVITSDGGILR